MTPRQKLATTQLSEQTNRHALGPSRMDVLLDGGLRRGDAALVHGPSFLGKGILARIAARAAQEAKQPTIFVSTRREGADLLSMLGIAGKPDALMQVIDTFSAGVGAKATPGVKLVDGPTDLNGLAAAVNNAQAAIQGKHKDHLLVIDSLSTLIAHNSPEAVFRFLQVLLGANRRAGGHAVILLDDAMHAAHDVESLKHLCAGTIQMRDLEGKHQVRILGFEVSNHIGWIDYHANEGQFDVIGSFAAGRIR